MDQLLTAVENYFIFPIDTNSSPPEEEPARFLTAREYGERMRNVLRSISEAQIALDDAHIDIQDHSAIIQTALREARRACALNASRAIFASVFRASAPEFAPLFDALLDRKEMSQINIRAP